MTVTLPLKEMTVAEKLQVMESIWDDLCHDEESIPMPDWHKEVLEERLKQEQEGKLQFIDWNIAKKQIRDAVS